MPPRHVPMMLIASMESGEVSTLLNTIETHANMDRCLTINSSKSVVPQYPAGRKTPSVDLQITGCVLDSEPTATHLGVRQGAARTINTQRIGTRTMYALFGAGLYGRNGFNPMVSAKIWTTYIRPRLLHNAELWCLNNTNTNILEKFQRDRLKQLQGLPPRTSNCVTLAMMGMFPIEDKNSLEFDICEKQLTVKGSKSRSWLICITTLLTKYNLSAPEHMLYSTPTKGTWKTLLLSRIQEHWNTHMYMEASVKSSLRFLSEDTLNVQLSFTPLKKSFIKARIMTGTYKLQAHESMYNQ